MTSRNSLNVNVVSGAGYGNRTRLAGLGSQNITTMLSPQSDAAVSPKRQAPRLSRTLARAANNFGFYQSRHFPQSAQYAGLQVPA